MVTGSSRGRCTVMSPELDCSSHTPEPFFGVTNKAVIPPSLVDARPDDLVAFAIDQALARVPEVERAEIVDVMVGCGFPEQKQGMNLARRAANLVHAADARAPVLAHASQRRL